jgi:hypothetical protein
VNSQRLAAVAAFVLAAFSNSCASRGPTKISPEVVLPKEFADQFEVRNVEDTSRAPLTEAERKAQLKKKSKKGVGPWVLGPLELPGGKITPKNFQWPYRRPTKDPIQMGEELTYNISYFGVSAGELKLTVLPFKMINQRKVYHFRAKVESSKVFNLVYRLNDYIESFLDYEGLFSHRYHMVMDESHQTRDALELYDSVKGQTFYWNRWNHKDKGYQEQKELQPMTRFPQDAISIMYYMRLVPLEVGQKLSIPAAMEGKSWVLAGEVLRREEIGSPMGAVNAFVIKPVIMREGKDQKKGDILFYVADTESRYPIRLEAKVKIGTVVMELSRIETGVPIDANQPVAPIADAPATESPVEAKPLPSPAP